MDVRGLRIVIIGDSHTQTGLGGELVPLLEAAGAKVTNVGIGGTSVEQWLRPVACFPGKDKDGCKADTKRTRIADVGQFDLVIVSLGTNDGANAAAGGKPNGSFAGPWVPKLIQAASRLAPRMFYVGPPAMRGTQPHYTDANIQPYFEAARAVLGGAAIDSYTVTKPFVATSGDGVHLSKGSQAAKQWARAAFDAITAKQPYKRGGAGGGKTSMAALTALAGGLIIYLWWRGRQATVLMPQPSLAGLRRR